MVNNSSSEGGKFQNGFVDPVHGMQTDNMVKQARTSEEIHISH